MQDMSKCHECLKQHPSVGSEKDAKESGNDKPSNIIASEAGVCSLSFPPIACEIIARHIAFSSDMVSGYQQYLEDLARLFQKIVRRFECSHVSFHIYILDLQPPSLIPPCHSAVFY